MNCQLENENRSTHTHKINITFVLPGCGVPNSASLCCMGELLLKNCSSKNDLQTSQESMPLDISELIYIAIRKNP